MVAQWGYSKDGLAPVAWESPDGNGGIGPQGASPETETRIDAEVKAIVADAYAECKRTLQTHRDMLEDLTEMLIEEETVAFDALIDLVAKYNAPLAEKQRAKVPPSLA